MSATAKTTPTIEASFHNAAGAEVGAHEKPVMFQLKFSNGTTLRVDGSDLDQGNVAEACMWHGLKQKLVDAAAIARNQETGKSATVDDKYNAVLAVFERLLSGQWNAPRAEGTGAGGLLLRAMVQHTGKSHEDIKTFLDGLTTEQQNALRKNPKIAAIIATLKPEAKANPSIDSDALLDAASK